MTSGIGLTSPNVPCMASRGVEQLFYYILLADVVNIDVRNDHTCPNAFRRDVVEIQELNIHLTSSDVFNHDVGITRLGRHMFVGIGDESLCSDGTFVDTYFCVERVSISYSVSISSHLHFLTLN